MSSKTSSLGVKKWYLLLLVIVPLLFTGCSEDGEEEEEGSSAKAPQGWHFQGRDCLACHNVDLQAQRHLSFGGTLYVDKNVTDTNNISNVCGGELIINFYDTAPSLVISSKYNEDSESKGYQGKGNAFILARQGQSLNMNYFIQITDKNGTVLATSPTHYFSGMDYNINNSADDANNLSCNACHNNVSGKTWPLYAQTNKTLCK